MIKNLRILRTTSGISQQKLAETIMVSQQSINKYENHNVEPDINTLIRIADFFNVSIDYLVGRTPVPDRADNLSYDSLSGYETTIINKFRKLSKKQQECVKSVIESYIDI